MLAANSLHIRDQIQLMRGMLSGISMHTLKDVEIVFFVKQGPI